MFATIAGQTNQHARVMIAAVPSLPCRKQTIGHVAPSKGLMEACTKKLAILKKKFTIFMPIFKMWSLLKSLTSFFRSSIPSSCRASWPYRWIGRKASFFGPLQMHIAFAYIHSIKEYICHQNLLAVTATQGMWHHITMHTFLGWYEALINSSDNFHLLHVHWKNSHSTGQSAYYLIWH